MKGDTCNARGDLKFGSSMKIVCFFFRFLSYNCEKDRENALLRWRKMLGAREMLVNFVALPDLNYDDVSLEGAMGTSLRRCSWSGKNSYQSLLCQHMCLAYRAPSPRAWGWVLVDCGFTMVCVCVFFVVLFFSWPSWSCKCLEDLQATLGWKLWRWALRRQSGRIANVTGLLCWMAECILREVCGIGW